MLSWFGKRKNNAGKVYRRYIQDGIQNGHRDDSVGGGLVRTLGGWSRVLSSRKSMDKLLRDKRILGRDEFVERIISEADERITGRISINERKINAKKKIIEVCSKEGVSVGELKGGGRRAILPGVRVQLAMELVRGYGLTLAETARQLGVSTSAISKIFNRSK